MSRSAAHAGVEHAAAGKHGLRHPVQQRAGKVLAGHERDGAQPAAGQQRKPRVRRPLPVMRRGARHPVIVRVGRTDDRLAGGVPAGAAQLLVQRGQVGWRRHAEHGADVGPVDAEPERGGGDDDERREAFLALARRLPELGHHRRLLRLGKPAVESPHPDAGVAEVLAQVRVQPHDLLHRQAVEDRVVIEGVEDLLGQPGDDRRCRPRPATGGRSRARGGSGFPAR